MTDWDRYFHPHLVLLDSMRVYPENTGNSEKWSKKKKNAHPLNPPSMGEWIQQFPAAGGEFLVVIQRSVVCDVRNSQVNLFKNCFIKEIATSFIQRTVELLVMTVLDRYFHDSLVPFYGLRIFPFCLNYFSNRKIIAPIEMVTSII